MNGPDPLDLVESMGDLSVEPDTAFRERLLADLLDAGVGPTRRAPDLVPTDDDHEPPTLIEIREHRTMPTTSNRARLGLWLGAAAAAVLLVVGAVVLLDDTETAETDVATTSAPTTSVPPAPTTEAPAPPAFDVSGTWESSFGQLTLTLDGSTLRGVAVLDGWTAIYEGELVGDVVTGTWYPEVAGIPCDEERFGTSSWGTFEWRFDGPTSFTGTEGNCLDEHQLQWRGTLVEEPEAPDAAIGPPGLDVAGTWDTDIGSLTLTTSGGSVTGSYLLEPPLVGAGEIEAEFDGEVLIGTWTEAITPELCGEQRLGTVYWGTFEWRFDGDGFTGSRGFCDGPRDEPWNGARSDGG
ncbi:MAG: hypothetical protein AAFZ07_02520 [Actinomycetota bacterium]